jgi:hypothetical protein
VLFLRKKNQLKLLAAHYCKATYQLSLEFIVTLSIGIVCGVGSETSEVRL